MFINEEEREKLNTKDCIELQICKNENLFKFSFFKSDSIYVLFEDLNNFYNKYSEIIGNGLYQNGLSGPIDTNGINFYSKEQARKILEKVKNIENLDTIFISFLENSIENNGFYILGF